MVSRLTSTTFEFQNKIFFSIFLEFLIQSLLCTVGNREAKNPKSDSSKFCFRTFFRYSVPQLRKNHNMKPLVFPHFSPTGLQSQIFGGTPSLLWLRKGQLWKQISRVLFRFCSTYIYLFERFFSQLFNYVYISKTSVFRLEKKTQKKQ